MRAGWSAKLREWQGIGCVGVNTLGRNQVGNVEKAGAEAPKYYMQFQACREEPGHSVKTNR